MQEERSMDLTLKRRPTMGPPPPRTLRRLARAAGITFNGDAPWDIQVSDSRAYRMIFSHGSLGLGEAYMEGYWDCERLDELFARLLNSELAKWPGSWRNMQRLGAALRHRLFNLQSISRAFEVGDKHYDLGNDVFEAMLDPTMSYSCGYWANASTLDEAQQNKLDLICRKLELQSGERLLDIGCGWGSLAQFAATRYGAEVVGITVSNEQQKIARERCAGLPVSIGVRDYRDLAGTYDKIVSVGMFEHVGPKNYSLYFDVVRRILNNDGLFLLHTIGEDETTTRPDPWIQKYIFPNGKLPSAWQVTAALEGRFVIEDWHNFGTDYDHTLMAWWHNFDSNWPQLEKQYGHRFYRMWKYYLLSCAGFFRARQGHLWQLVLSKRKRSSIYRSIR
jgi:cyclopropane-fatty-acyl-phospholipid synthase